MARIVIGCLVSGVTAKSGRRIDDLTGMRFSRLTAVRPLGRQHHGLMVWETVCDCGKRKAVIGSNLRGGNVRSCGCLVGDSVTIHGGRRRSKGRSPTYTSWAAAKARCISDDPEKAKYYKSRGVKMCDRWRDDFAAFRADMGERPSGMTLDRWPDPNGDYEPGNCRWATALEQRRNWRPRTGWTS